MSEHETHFLGAYLDGELQGAHLRQVQTHLEGCQECQAELQSLQTLSQVLQTAPAPAGFISPERFTSQVMFHLPPRPTPSMRNTFLKAGPWLVPLVLLAAWLFLQVVFTLSGWLTTADHLGLLGEMAAWLFPANPGTAGWTSFFNLLGLLPEGVGYQWAELGETLTRSLFSQVAWQVSFALFYLGWLAAWWNQAMQTRSEEPYRKLSQI